MLKIPWVPILRQNGQLWLFGPKFAKKWILGLKIPKTNFGKIINILEIPCAPTFRQNEQLWHFGSKFAQKWILGSEFQKINAEIRISILEISRLPISKENGQLCLFGPKFAPKWVFWPKFGEIDQLPAIFWFEYCWGCCRELDGGWNELGGSGWSWVEVGARFSNTHVFLRIHREIVKMRKNKKQERKLS